MSKAGTNRLYEADQTKWNVGSPHLPSGDVATSLLDIAMENAVKVGGGLAYSWTEAGVSPTDFTVTNAATTGDNFTISAAQTPFLAVGDVFEVIDVNAGVETPTGEYVVIVEVDGSAVTVQRAVNGVGPHTMAADDKINKITSATGADSCNLLDRSSAKVDRENFFQQFARVADSSDAYLETDTIDNPQQFENEQMIKELSVDVDRALLFGEALAADPQGAPGNYPQMKGLEQLYEEANGTSDPLNDQGLPSDFNITDAATFNRFLGLFAFKRDPGANLLIMSVKTAEILTDALQENLLAPDESTTVTRAVMRYLSQFGVIDLVVVPDLEDNIFYVLRREYLRLVIRNEMTVKPLPPQALCKGFLISGTFTLQGILAATWSKGKTGT